MAFYIKKSVNFYSLPLILYLYKLSAMKRKIQRYWDYGSCKTADKKHRLQFIHRKFTE